MKGSPLSAARLTVARLLGAAAGWASRATGRGEGETLPGVLILRLAPDALARLSANRSTTLISGTNGKSTTTALIVTALGRPTTTNPLGANVASGVVTALAASSQRTTVLEVDELSLRRIASDTRAHLIVAMNLTRDQLDRAGEVGRIERDWHRTFAESGAHVIANAADPLVVSAVGDAPATWVDPGWSWPGDSMVCPACTELLTRVEGRWFCTCGLHQPTANYRVEGTTLVLPDGSRLPIEVPLPGRVNVANMAFAVATVAHHGVSAQDALARCANVREVSGRYSTIEVGGRPALLMLAKNPAGWAAALDMLRPDDAVVFSVNAQLLDGADTSWLWDVSFEEFGGRVVGAHGHNRHDLALRLEVAGADPRVDADIDAVARQLPKADRLVVLATYTSFRELRRRR